ARPAAARPPPVHDVALVPERVRAEGRRAGAEQVLLLAEELIAGRDHPGAQPPRGQVHMRVRHGLVSNLPAGAGPASWPRSQVRRTTPVSVRPAYGVTGCRWRRRAGSTVNSAGSPNPTRAASRPGAIAPLPASPASAAGPAAIQRTTSVRSPPRRRAPVHTAGRRPAPPEGQAGAGSPRPRPPRSPRPPAA